MMKATLIRNVNICRVFETDGILYAKILFKVYTIFEF